MFTDLQGVLAGDADQLLQSVVKVVDLVSQVVDLMLGVDPHERILDTEDHTKEPHVAIVEVVRNVEYIGEGILGDGEVYVDWICPRLALNSRSLYLAKSIT